MFLIKSTRYTNTVWQICSSFHEYKEFAKEIYTHKESDGFFGGQQFNYEEEWFGEEKITDWMELFGVPYVKEDLNDKYSNEYQINPLTDEYEITERPKDDEYPVIVRYSLIDNCLDWCSISKNRVTEES